MLQVAPTVPPMNPLEPELVATVVCPQCGADLAPQLTACPRCRAALRASSAHSALARPNSTSAHPEAILKGLGAASTAHSSVARPHGMVDSDQPPVMAEEVTTEPKRDKWLDNKLFILGMLFGATLFLGFPWLWKSRAFTRGGKVLITILVLVETVLVFWAFFAVMAWSYRTIRASM